MRNNKIRCFFCDEPVYDVKNHLQIYTKHIVRIEPFKNIDIQLQEQKRTELYENTIMLSLSFLLNDGSILL